MKRHAILLKTAYRSACLLGAMGAVSVCGAAMAAKPRLPESVDLTAILDGAQVVPGPGDPDGKGRFVATLARDSGELCYDLKVADIWYAMSVELHVGKPGEAHESLASLALPDAEGHASGCVTLDRKLTEHVMLLPQYYYVSVANVKFPQGAIRGQVAK